MLTQVFSDDIPGKVVKSTAEDNCGKKVIVFEDGTFLLLEGRSDSIEEPKFDVFDYGPKGSIEAGIMTEEEVAEAEAKRAADRQEWYKKCDLAKLKELKEKYPDA